MNFLVISRDFVDLRGNNDLYCQRCIDYVDILLGVPPLGGLQSQLLLIINWKFAVDFFARGLHTRAAVAGSDYALASASIGSADGPRPQVKLRNGSADRPRPQITTTNELTFASARLSCFEE